MKPQIIVASHRRSGTHLTMAALTNNFPVLSESIPNEEAFLEQLRGSSGKPRVPEIRRAVEAKSNVFFTHMHDLGLVGAYCENDPEACELVEEIFANAKVVYVQRDGRDTLASMYPWMQSQGHGQATNATFAEFLRQDNDWDPGTYEGDYSRPAYWRFHIENWGKWPEALSMRFEDFHADYQGCLKKLQRHTGLQLSARTTDVKRKPFLGFIPYGKWTRRIDKYVLNPLLKRKDQAHFFRKGTVGDYVNSFDSADLSYFDDQAGELMRSLGYATA